MAQVSRTVNDIIISAFLLIGEFDEYEPIPGPDFERAFDILNLIIDHFSGDATYIAFTETISFDLQPSKRDYVVSNVSGIIADVDANRIAKVEYANLLLNGQIMRPLTVINRTGLFTNQFNNTLQAIPGYVLVNKAVEKTTLSFYPIPNQVYPVEIRAKFYLNKFEKFQPIRNVPLYLHNFLIYELGRQLLNYYPSGNWSPTAEDKYMQLYQDVLNTNDIDMSVQPSDLLVNDSDYYAPYGIITGI